MSKSSHDEAPRAKPLSATADLRRGSGEPEVPPTPDAALALADRSRGRRGLDPLAEVTRERDEYLDTSSV